VVCTMIGEANAVPQYEIRKFLTLNHQLEQLRKCCTRTNARTS
jgi:hypothetical protein